MKVSTRKAKGRTLQNLVMLKLVSELKLDPDQIRTAIMGETGADVKLVGTARAIFPFEIECKNQERFKGLYDIYEQAKGHGKGEPLVIIKSNRKRPLVILDFDKFLEVYKNGIRD